MDLHVFPIPIPPPASLPIPSLWVFPVHQPWALVSCIQPGLVICFTLDSILVSMLFSLNIPPSPLLEFLKVPTLDCRDIQPVYPEGDRSWVFIGGTDAEAETPILRPPHVKSWLIGKGPDAGRDWGQEEKGTTEEEMVRWHHRPYGHEFEWTLGVCDGQGGLVSCDSGGRKESDTTERLN